MSVVRVGIVGYGNSAKTFHLPIIKATKRYEVAAILQRAEAPADKAAAAPGSHCTVDFPSAKHHRTADDFFADANIELVVVATRGDTHAHFAEQALEAGKHVIVDKPFATSSEEADRVIQLAKQKGLIATCYQNRRWDAGFQTLRQLVEQDALGDVKEAEIHYDFETPAWISSMTQTKYTPGAGMGFGLGTHSVDQALVLFGRPKSVTGFYRAQRGIESDVEDSFTIILQYDGPKKDLLVTVKTSITSPMQQQLKFLVRGTKGSYVKFQQRSTCVQEEKLSKGIDPLESDFGVEPEGLDGTLTTYTEFDSNVQQYDEPSGKYVGRYPTIPGRWVGLYENLAGAVKGENELAVLATQSRDALRVLELARESHNTGATVQWS